MFSFQCSVFRKKTLHAEYDHLKTESSNFTGPCFKCKWHRGVWLSQAIGATFLAVMLGGSNYTIVVLHGVCNLFIGMGLLSGVIRVRDLSVANSLDHFKNLGPGGERPVV